jgi:hypothetical protein
MSLQTEEVEAIAEATAKAMMEQKRAKWLDPESHSKQHDWVAAKMKAEQKKEEFRAKVLQSATIWALILVMGFLASALWEKFVSSITNHTPG